MKTIEIKENLTSIVNGLNKAANVVISTMGAEGKNVIVSDNYDKLRFTKDGVTVAKSIKLNDVFENIGANILITAANKTVQNCGDGTTLTCLLSQNMINETLRLLNNGENPNAILEMFQKDLNLTIETLRFKSRELKTYDDIKDIATVSSKDEEIGNLIKEIYEKTGFEPSISLEKGEYVPYTYYEISNGLEFRASWAHSGFITDKKTEQCIYENAFVFVSGEDILTLDTKLQSLLDNAYKEDIPIVIIAPKFSDSVIRICTMNKINNNAKIVLLKLPGWAESLNRNVEDINAFLSEEGFVEKIIATPFSYTLYNTDCPLKESRVKQLKELAENSIETYDEVDYKKRIHALNGSACIIYVGDINEQARDEQFDRIEDAVGAVKTAVHGGLSEGGGYELFSIATDFHNKLSKSFRKVLETPVRQIIKNANLNPDIILPKRYDIKNKKEVISLNDLGIIDPTNVIMEALQNAFSITKLLINTSYTIYNEYKKS